MAEEKPRLTISTEVLCLVAGAFIAIVSLLASLKSTGQVDYQTPFICLTIGTVGALITLSIRQATEIIVAQLKKEE